MKSNLLTSACALEQESQILRVSTGLKHICITAHDDQPCEGLKGSGKEGGRLMMHSVLQVLLLVHGIPHNHFPQESCRNTEGHDCQSQFHDEAFEECIPSKKISDLGSKRSPKTPIPSDLHPRCTWLVSSVLSCGLMDCGSRIRGGRASGNPEGSTWGRPRQTKADVPSCIKVHERCLEMNRRRHILHSVW